MIMCNICMMELSMIMLVFDEGIQSVIVATNNNRCTFIFWLFVCFVHFRSHESSREQKGEGRENHK
jgi:hypothetical protein